MAASNETKEVEDVMGKKNSKILLQFDFSKPFYVYINLQKTYYAIVSYTMGKENQRPKK